MEAGRRLRGARRAAAKAGAGESGLLPAAGIGRRKRWNAGAAWSASPLIGVALIGIADEAMSGEVMREGAIQTWRAASRRGGWDDPAVQTRERPAPEGPGLLIAIHPAMKPVENGAGEGIRTLDPNLGKVVLYP